MKLDLKVDQALADAALAAAKVIEAKMKRRIFNEGRAVNGSIGKYRSRSYRAKRRAAGRQIGKKDLEFHGDLRRSIQTGKRSMGAVVGFTNDRSRKIMGYQEDQTGKNISGVTDATLKSARAAFKKIYRAKISR